MLKGSGQSEPEPFSIGHHSVLQKSSGEHVMFKSKQLMITHNDSSHSESSSIVLGEQYTKGRRHHQQCSWQCTFPHAKQIKDMRPQMNHCDANTRNTNWNICFNICWWICVVGSLLPHLWSFSPCMRLDQGAQPLLCRLAFSWDQQGPDALQLRLQPQ